MQQQDMAITKCLVSVAWADGEFHDKEREMVEGILSAFGANEQEAHEVRAYASEKKTLDDMPLSELDEGDRRVLLQHAVLLTFVDGEQHESEKQTIAALCTRLRIPEAEAQGLVSTAEARAKRFLNLL